MRIRQHVNPLKSDLLDIADVPRVEAPAGRALEVELGAAEAHFLIDRARQDRRRRSSASRSGASWSRRSTRPARRRAPTNVRSVFANMSVDMGRLFADASVRRFFLNFPDPWFKSRQHKRRVIGPGLMAEIGRALAPGGELHVQTDIFELALDAMAALELEGASAGRASSTPRARGRSCARAPTPRSRGASASARARACGSGGCSTAGAAPLPNPLRPLRGARGPDQLRAHREADLFQLLDAVADRGGLLELEASRRGRTSRLRMAEMIWGISSSGMSACLGLLGRLRDVDEVVLGAARQLLDRLLDGLGRDAVRRGCTPPAWRAAARVTVIAFFIESVSRSAYMITLPRDVARGAADGLDQRALGAQEAFLVGVEDRRPATPRAGPAPRAAG